MQNKFEAVRETNTDLDYALQCAIQPKPNFELAKLLIENGANVRVWNDVCLRLACQEANKYDNKEYISLCKLFLEHGADIHANNDEIFRFYKKAFLLLGTFKNETEQ